MDDERRNSLVLYESWHEYLKKLTPEQYVKGMDMIVEYALDGVIPETDDMALLGFMFGILPVINSNNKRWRAAKRGGRPRKNNEQEIKTDEKVQS